jgi:hypothetical protein
VNKVFIVLLILSSLAFGQTTFTRSQFDHLIFDPTYEEGSTTKADNDSATLILDAGAHPNITCLDTTDNISAVMWVAKDSVVFGDEGDTLVVLPLPVNAVI